MDQLVRRVERAMIDEHAERHSDPDAIDLDDPRVSREWLVTNGLGGYASGTVSGIISRRFHGLLIAALPAPQGRTMMLNHLSEVIHLPERGKLGLSAYERPDGLLHPTASRHLHEFRLEAAMPIWRYELGGGISVEKRLFLPHGQNTVLITYKIDGAPGPVRLDLQPWVNFRPHEGALDSPIDEPYALTVKGDRYELMRDGLPPLRMQLYGARRAFSITGNRLTNVRYYIEESRNDARGDLYSPGFFTVDITNDAPVTLVASTEPWDVIGSSSPRKRSMLNDCGEPSLSPMRTPVRAVARLVNSCWRPISSSLLLRAAYGTPLTLGPPGDGMDRNCRLSLVHRLGAGHDDQPGRADLSTGRQREAGYILRTFGHYVRDGLIPNMFPEGTNDGLYHTADATLWFFHAIDRYCRYTGDWATSDNCCRSSKSIVDHHVQGTRFGIGVDSRRPLRAGEEAIS